MIGERPAPARPGRHALAADLLGWLPLVTVSAVGVELVVLRLLTRTAIHIPGFSRLGPVYLTISEVGRSAFYLASVLLVTTLALLVWSLARRGGRTEVVCAAGLLLFAVAAAIARAGEVDAAILAVAASVAVLLVAPWSLGGAEGPSRTARTLVLASFLAAALLAEPTGLFGPGVSGRLVPFAELLAVMAAIATPLMAGAIGRGAIVAGAVAAGVVLTASVMQPATTKILMLWNVGLAGYLPAPFYAAAAGALAATVISLRARGRALTAAGLLLTVAGGLGFHSTYQTGLVLVGLVLMGTGERSVPELDPRRTGATDDVDAVGYPSVASSTSFTHA